MQARPSLLFIYKVLPKFIQRAIVRTLFPTYVVCSKVYLENNEGKFLVVKPTYHKNWDIPSGHTDKGESPDDAAKRELLEETGITIDYLEQKAAVFQPMASTVQVLFAGKLDHSPEHKADNIEISEIRWVSRGEVDLNPHAVEALEVLLDHKVAYWVSPIGH